MKTHALPAESKTLLCNSKVVPHGRLFTADPAKVSCKHCRRSLRKGVQTSLPLADDLDKQAEETEFLDMFERGTLQPEDV
jgi:hypothetical protein